MIGQNPVDLFRHGLVEAAQTGFDMHHRNMQLAGCQRSGQCRIGIAIDYQIVRTLIQQYLFYFDKHLSGHGAMCRLSAVQLPGRTCYSHFREEDTTHVLVVMLSGVDQLLVDGFPTRLVV